jgi:DNA-binding transcriptional LysR family regulator
VRAYGEGRRGSVRVAYGASASYETAPRLLHQLKQRHPEISVTTEVKSVNEIVASLLDGSLDLGLVRCRPDIAELESRSIRLERQVVLLRRDHPLASRPSLDLTALHDEVLALHPREANPGHYDAVVALCRAHGYEPRILVRSLTFDLAYSPITGGEAVTIVGESSAGGLPGDVCWLPLSEPVSLEVSLLARRIPRSAAVARLLDAATEVSRELGWT